MQMGTETGVIIIAFAVMLFVFAYFWRAFSLTQSAASIVTVIGILGTFVGIAYGLYEFNPEEIEISIPNLLAGLKIAFVTSIFGIFLSVILKFRAAYVARKAEKAGERAPTGATIDDLAASLWKIYESQKEEAETTRKSLASIENALTGEGETTVVTQLQKIRTSFSDKQDELIRSFNEFASKMAEYNYAALIKALQEVIKDFNVKISEQFGENFKQLNQAVEKILVWQEQYRKQMDELAQEFHIAAAATQESEKAIRRIAVESERIGANAEKLEPILTTMANIQRKLADDLEAFSRLRDKAVEAFPVIESRLNDLTTNFSNHVKQAVSISNESVEALTKTVQSQGELLNSVVNDSRKAIETLAARTDENIERIYQNTSKRMETQLTNLDQELSKELTKSLESLGSQLASLSSKFVEDYTPLTEKLRQVVQIARSTEYA